MRYIKLDAERKMQWRIRLQSCFVLTEDTESMHYWLNRILGALLDGKAKQTVEEMLEGATMQAINQVAVNLYELALTSEYLEEYEMENNCIYMLKKMRGCYSPAIRNHYCYTI